jgi:hypothetical protein
MVKMTKEAHEAAEAAANMVVDKAIKGGMNSDNLSTFLSPIRAGLKAAQTVEELDGFSKGIEVGISIAEGINLQTVTVMRDFLTTYVDAVYKELEISRNAGTVCAR